MIRFLPNSIKGLSLVAGAEIILTDEGYHIQFALLEKRKGNVKILKSQVNIVNYLELKYLIDKEIPIAVSISGKGILHKKVEKTELSPSQLLSQIIPNAKSSEFYLQLTGFVLSIIRKSVLEELLLEFDKVGLNIISISLGGLPIKSILPLLDTQDSEILHVCNHTIQFKSDEVVSYEYDKNNLQDLEYTTIGTDKVQSKLIAAYSCAFQQFLNLQIEIQNPTLTLKRDEFISKGVFKKIAFGALGFFFFVLLVNFVVFSITSAESSKLMVAYDLHQDHLELLNKLQKEVKEKERFFQNEGWLHISKSSYYSDRIAASVPASVLLKTLTINPANELESRNLRKQIFDDNLIIITGSCNHPIDLNGWISKLKDFSWVKKVNVETYQFDSGQKAGNFKIEVQF
ncbi:MAG: hypothetical protein H7329_00595 [Opitutaceae bacterium]|nr:hypothetical protein [Cytophagales bacterium]